METLKSDVKRIKRLIKDENKEEIKKLSTIFLPEYNLKIYIELNGYERHIWLKFNGYIPLHNEAHNLAEVK